MQAQMQLIQDKELEEDVGPYYGEVPRDFLQCSGPGSGRSVRRRRGSHRLHLIPDRAERDER